MLLVWNVYIIKFKIYWILFNIYNKSFMWYKYMYSIIYEEFRKYFFFRVVEGDVSLEERYIF